MLMYLTPDNTFFRAKKWRPGQLENNVKLFRDLRAAGKMIFLDECLTNNGGGQLYMTPVIYFSETPLKLELQPVLLKLLELEIDCCDRHKV